jgi:hypothetical protein
MAIVPQFRDCYQKIELTAVAVQLAVANGGQSANDVIAIAGSQFDSTSDLAKISNFRRDYTVAARFGQYLARNLTQRTWLLRCLSRVNRNRNSS